MKILRYINTIFIILLFSSCMDSQIALRNVRSQHESKILFELFVMSQCPFAVEAEKAIIPILYAFKDQIDLKLYFIAQEAGDAKEWIEHAEIMDETEEDEIEDNAEGKCRGVFQIDPDAQFYSLHGQSEVEEDIRQLIIMKYYPEEFLDYLLYRAENYGTFEWEASASKAWLDIERIKAIMDGPEGEQLFRDNIKRAKELRIDSSPTLLINGKQYRGQIAKNSLSRYLCKNVVRHKACQKLPVCGGDQDCQRIDKVGLCLNPNTDQARCQFASPREVKLTVIQNKNMKSEKEEEHILSTFKDLFPKGSIETIDYQSSQRTALIDKYGLTTLPAYIFDKDVEKALRFVRIKETLLKKEDGYIIKPCYLSMVYYINREEKKGCLDLFVESLSEMDNYLEYDIMMHPLFGKLPIKIHFLAKKMENAVNHPAKPGMTKTKDNDHSHILDLQPKMPLAYFKSKEGTSEIQENIRQLCIAEKEPEKYKDYLSCIHKKILGINGDKTWEVCIREAEIDNQTISFEQMNGRGVELLSEDIALADKLGITASPAILINNNILLRNFTIKMIEELVSPRDHWHKLGKAFQ